MRPGRLWRPRCKQQRARGWPPPPWGPGARGMGAASAFEHRAEAGEIGALPRGVAREESHEESIGESIDVEAALRKSGAVHTHLQDKARRTTATRPFEI